MTDLLEQLRRQAEGIDAVEPVTAAEGRNRAEWSPYSPDTEPRPGPATRRRRRPLVAAAAVLVAVLAVASAVTWNADRTATGPAASAPAYYLPPAPPPGMHLAAKIDAPGRTPRIVASLARSDPPGRIVVVASPAPAQPELGDFADAVDVGGRSGTITSNADGSTDVAFTAGSATYVVTSSSTTDDVLLAVARSLRADGDHVAVEPPAGWRLLAPVAYADTAVHLTYIDDGLGIAVVDVYPAGGALVDQIAATEPGVTVLGRGAAARRRGDGGPGDGRLPPPRGRCLHRVWATNSYADNVPSDLARSVAEVSQATWDATTPDPGHAVPYEPDPVRYLPLLTAGSTRPRVPARSGGHVVPAAGSGADRGGRHVHLPARRRRDRHRHPRRSRPVGPHRVRGGVGRGPRRVGHPRRRHAGAGDGGADPGRRRVRVDGGARTRRPRPQHRRPGRHRPHRGVARRAPRPLSERRQARAWPERPGAAGANSGRYGFVSRGAPRPHCPTL